MTLDALLTSLWRAGMCCLAWRIAGAILPDGADQSARLVMTLLLYPGVPMALGGIEP